MRVAAAEYYEHLLLTATSSGSSHVTWPIIRGR